MQLILLILYYDFFISFSDFASIEYNMTDDSKIMTAKLIELESGQLVQTSLMGFEKLITSLVFIFTVPPYPT